MCLCDDSDEITQRTAVIDPPLERGKVLLSQTILSGEDRLRIDTYLIKLFIASSSRWLSTCSASANRLQTSLTNSPASNPGRRCVQTPRVAHE